MLSKRFKYVTTQFTKKIVITIITRFIYFYFFIFWNLHFVPRVLLLLVAKKEHL